MKKLILLIFGLLIFAACAPQTQMPSQMAPQVTTQVKPADGTPAGKDFNSPNAVEIKDFAFNPSEITIKAGETVTWTNGDSAPHTITSDSGTELASDPINNGQSYSHTFDKAGEYDYHCSIHTMMKGKVIVQ